MRKKATNIEKLKDIYPVTGNLSLRQNILLHRGEAELRIICDEKHVRLEKKFIKSDWKTSENNFVLFENKQF